MRLAGKVAVISGGGSGIGQASCELFAREGASVVVADILGDAANQTVARIEAAGGKAVSCVADATRGEDVARTMQLAVERFGGIDVVFNNAGGSTGVLKPVGDTSEEEWDRVIALNVKSAFLGCHHAIPHLLHRGGGAIVNTASAAGLVGWVNMAAYSTAKGAVVLLTKCASIDYAQQGIRVNCICPGTINTPLIERNIRSRPGGEQTVAQMAARHPMNRLGEPGEVARVALFLASDESSYVTGAAVSVDGGYVAW